MLRVKNEARWISEVLRSILPLCSRVFVMDDHSTDNTREICASFPEVTVLQSTFDSFNESRDKNWLLDQVMQAVSPDWILAIDGDEVLEPNGPEIIQRTVEATTVNAYSLKIEYLWGDARTVRSDRVYGEFWRPSIFRPFVPRPGVPDDQKLLSEFKFMSTPFGRRRNGNEPNFHCSSVPQRLLHGHQRCPARLKHYGYMLREDRVRKLDFYTWLDWKNAAEDSYRHMTQGDAVTLDELPRTRELLASGDLTAGDIAYMLATPPDAYLLHAGPIQLKPIEF